MDFNAILEKYLQNKKLELREKLFLSLTLQIEIMEQVGIHADARGEYERLKQMKARL